MPVGANRGFYKLIGQKNNKGLLIFPLQFSLVREIFASRNNKSVPRRTFHFGVDWLNVCTAFSQYRNPVIRYKRSVKMENTELLFLRSLKRHGFVFASFFLFFSSDRTI